MYNPPGLNHPEVLHLKSVDTELVLPILQLGVNAPRVILADLLPLEVEVNRCARVFHLFGKGGTHKKS